MATRDLSAFFDDGALEYPGIRSTAHPDGKTYKVPSPDARTGAWLASIAELGVRSASGAEMAQEDAAKLKLDDEQERTWYQRILGPAYDEMIADGVAWVMLKRVGDDAYLCFGLDEDVADMVLASQGEPQARANRATRRATQHTDQKTAGSKSGRASTATKGRTRSRASTPSSTSPTELEAEAKAV
jgi:hypothetical protein